MTNHFLRQFVEKRGKNMKTIELLKFLQNKIGGELDYVAAAGTDRWKVEIPRLLVEIQDEHVRFEIKNKTELFINVYTVPSHFLKIYHENFATKLLDKVHLHSEIKIGDEEFDDKYVIEFATPEIARTTMNAEFKECILNLEPFKIFQMTKRDYTLLKVINKFYDVEAAENDINNMVRIVKICSEVWD